MSYKCVEQPIKACEPSYVSETAMSFFILVVHSPLKIMGYVIALKLSSHIKSKVRTIEYVTASKLTLSERRDTKLRDTGLKNPCRSSP
jgi:hypothetical protein